ncbi:MAG TPA: hypothetical protein VEF92_06115 [Burkholderiales bacterium]|nr:hypothetical protein [Burkholderiales bacterium]HYA47110.1 hypothetical protein [Burkholderiales bacterium]
MTEAKVKGRLTIRITALLMLASALLELLSVNSDVVLFGDVRSGPVMTAYHLMYVVAFLLVGIGLWRARPWGYWAVMATTALYTLDKIQFLLARDSYLRYVQQVMSSVDPQLAQALPKEGLQQLVTVLYASFVVCWWGFAIYIHLRRAYFVQPAAPDYKPR